jgi:hypothetical protein
MQMLNIKAVTLKIKNNTVSKSRSKVKVQVARSKGKEQTYHILKCYLLYCRRKRLIHDLKKQKKKYIFFIFNVIA